MIAFFKYWQQEYESTDDYGKVLVVIIVLHMVLLCAILISLPVGLYFISKNTTREKEEWMMYKTQNDCVAVAQSAPKEVRRLSGKIYVTRLEAGDVTWQCKDGNTVVRTWEQSQ